MFTKSIYRLSGISYLLFSLLAILQSPAAAGVSLVIDQDGYLGLSNEAPLRGYRTDEELLSEYRGIAAPCLGEVKPDDPLGQSPDFCPDGAKLSRYVARNILLARRLKGGAPGLSPLHEEEVAAFLTYVMAAYESINSALWNSRLPEDPYNLVTMRLILSAMNKLPDYKGGAIRADFYVGQAALTEATLEKRLGTYIAHMESGRSYAPKGFWSTSWVDSGHNQVADPACTALTLEIDSITGKSLAPIMNENMDREIIFLPGARFVVENISGRQPKPVTPCNPLGYGYTVKLRELP